MGTRSGRLGAGRPRGGRFGGRRPLSPGWRATPRGRMEIGTGRMRLRRVHRSAQAEQRRHLRSNPGLDFLLSQADGAHHHCRRRARRRRARTLGADRLGRPLAPDPRSTIGRCTFRSRALGTFESSIERRTLRRGRVAARGVLRIRTHGNLLATRAAGHGRIDSRRSGSQVHAGMFGTAARAARTHGFARAWGSGLDRRTNPGRAPVAPRICRDDRILRVGRRCSRSRFSRLRLARGARAAFGVTKNLGQESQRRVPLPEVSASRSPVAVSVTPRSGISRLYFSRGSGVSRSGVRPSVSCPLEPAA